jgi:hypothetical protein
MGLHPNQLQSLAFTPAQRKLSSRIQGSLPKTPVPSLFSLQVIPGKGLGLVAEANIEPGTLIFAEHPLIAPGLRIFDRYRYCNRENNLMI